MAARRRGVGSLDGSPDRPDLNLRISAIAQIGFLELLQTAALGKQSFQRPQRTILTEGGKQPCAGSTLGGIRAMALTIMSRPARIQVQPRGHELQTRNPADEPGAGMAQSRPGHLAR